MDRREDSTPSDRADNDDPVLDAVAATGRPAAIRGGPARPGVQLVAADDRSAARAVAGQLLTGALSSRAVAPARPATVRRTALGSATDVPFPVTRARLAGCRDAVEDSGRRWVDVPVTAGARDALGQSVRVSGWDDSDLATALAFSSVRQSLWGPQLRFDPFT